VAGDIDVGLYSLEVVAGRTGQRSAVICRLLAMHVKKPSVARYARTHARCVASGTDVRSPVVDHSWDSISPSAETIGGDRDAAKQILIAAGWNATVFFRVVLGGL